MLISGLLAAGGCGPGDQHDAPGGRPMSARPASTEETPATGRPSVASTPADATSPKRPPVLDGKSPMAGSVSESGGLLTDITTEVGISLPEGPWPDGRYHTPEITPGGVALFDYDNDGDLDLFVVNFATFDLHKRCSPTGRQDDLDYCGPHEFPGLLDTLAKKESDVVFFARHTRKKRPARYMP